MKHLWLFISLFSFALTPWSANAAELSPEEIKGAQTINAQKAKELFDKEVIFVDVRKTSDWDAGRIPGAHHIELKKVFNEKSLGNVAKKNDEVVIYCNGPKCKRSSKASEKAVAWGYKKIYYFREGYPSWKKAGLPVE